MFYDGFTACPPTTDQINDFYLVPDRMSGKNASDFFLISILLIVMINEEKEHFKLDYHYIWLLRVLQCRRTFKNLLFS